MKSIEVKFDEIKKKNEQKIKKLEQELNKYWSITDILNLDARYHIYLRELDNLFRKNKYIVCYFMYKEFHDIILRKYNFFYFIADYVHGCGNLPGAFLDEASFDLTIWIKTLLKIEMVNGYKEKNTKVFLSFKLYDYVLNNKKFF